ncbi:MAG: orotidine-5'-phosphate decarboxylase, partial [Actinomycetota bacterium]
MPRSTNPLIVAADVSSPALAADLAARLAGIVAMLKIGLEYFTAVGPDGVTRLRDQLPVFVDLKLHDIPTTVHRAARNLGRLGAAMLTVHAAGGEEMVRAAVEGSNEGADEVGRVPPAVVGVTVLSSLEEAGSVSPVWLADRVMAAGAHGVVVSGRHVQEVRAALGPEALLVVPGIRASNENHDDHARVLTPTE